MPPKADLPPEPWLAFFEELDHQLRERLSIHCLGGFVLVHQYRVARTTVDLDFAAVVPHHLFAKLVAMGGKTSPLCVKHRVFLDPVTVAAFPENYVSRLSPIYAGAWKHLELQAMEVHDLMLAKIERNSARDRYDLLSLAQAGLLDTAILQRRYFEELRPYLLSRPESHDLTLDLWIESCREKSVDLER
jgi:Nucleotidyltransferase of unknown function (DUF6036)